MKLIFDEMTTFVEKLAKNINMYREHYNIHVAATDKEKNNKIIEVTNRIKFNLYGGRLFAEINGQTGKMELLMLIDVSCRRLQIPKTLTILNTRFDSRFMKHDITAKVVEPLLCNDDRTTPDVSCLNYNIELKCSHCDFALRAVVMICVNQVPSEDKTEFMELLTKFMINDVTYGASVVQDVPPDARSMKDIKFKVLINGVLVTDFITLRMDGILTKHVSET